LIDWKYGGSAELSAGSAGAQGPMNGAAAIATIER